MGLGLSGSAEDIYRRASDIIFKNMIPEIIEGGFSAVPQTGRVVVFKRRTPQQSMIPADTSLEKVYDIIRMLDAEGYPSAFLESGKLRFEFSKAVKKHGKIEALVSIFRKDRV